MSQARDLERRTSTVPWWAQVLRGERKGLLADSVRQLARLSSMGYRVGVRGRELAYRNGWLEVKRLPQPTICVGNITVGGTGKTPLVIRLVSDLLQKGLRPAVLLRGYRRERVSRHPVLVRDPQKIRATVADAGDEAMELAVRLPGAWVGVGADRYATGRFLLSKGPVDCFVLDDGFQHHRLERDINIVTVDVTDPWGGGELLPAGLLREPPEALRRADVVVLTRTGSVGPDRLAVLREQVSSHMRENSAVLESSHESLGFVGIGNPKVMELGALRGKKVLAVSAIGNPRAFELSLQRLGAQVVGALRLSDHSGRAEAVWSWVLGHQRSFQWVIMTEKDAMRWGIPPAGLGHDVFALRMDLHFTSGLNHWNHLVTLVERLVKAR